MFSLFLKADPGEKRNLASECPERVAEMSRMLLEIVDNRYGLPLYE